MGKTHASWVKDQQWHLVEKEVWDKINLNDEWSQGKIKCRSEGKKIYKLSEDLRRDCNG